MKIRLTPLGAVLILVFAAGVLVFFVGSGATAAIGGLVALVAIAFAVGDQLPAGLGGGFVLGKGRRSSRDQPAPEPDYIERAATPSDAAWQRERKLYGEKETHSHDDA